ncbi:MAG TPA: hypothetical protein VEF04_11000, partial [Blastocatellia bacterium]|nr:hypothetical protein [Blastocatellia bacterium]
GRATFLVTGLHGSSEPTALATYQNDGSHLNTDGTIEKLKLLPLLGLSAEFQDVLSRAIPALAEMSVVDDLHTALESTVNQELPASFITWRGERLSAGYLISGGSDSSQAKGILALKREISELSEHHEKLQSTEKNLEEELQDSQAVLAGLINKRSVTDARLRETEQLLALQKQQRQQCEREVTRTATHLSVIERETAHALSEKEEFAQKLAHANEEMQLAEQIHTEAQRLTHERQSAVAEIRRQTAESLQKLSGRRADFAAKTERRRALQNEIRRLENEIQDILRRLDRNQLEAIEAEEQIRLLEQSSTTLREEISELEKSLGEYRDDFNQLSQQLQGQRERLQALSQNLKQQRDALLQIRDERSKLEIEQARLSAGIDHLKSACQSELGEDIVEICAKAKLVNLQNKSPEIADDVEATKLSAPTSSEQTSNEDQNTLRYQSQVTAETDSDFDDELADAAQSDLSFWYVPDDFDLSAAKIKLDELRAKIDNLGPVNLMAIDELIEVEERLNFLLDQKADIDRALADTQAAIAEIKNRSRERFVEAFQIINRNFAEMFVELFGGG